MASEASHARTVLVFGSQALSLGQATLQNLQSSISGSAALQWVPGAISELPKHLESITACLPQIGQSNTAEKLLSGLEEWMETGNLPTPNVRPPNIILTPLYFLAHLNAYGQFCELAGVQLKDLEDSGQSHPLANTETVGFCTGLLAALATSLSGSKAEMAYYGPIILRLAMLIGAVADAQDAKFGEYTSFSAAWTSREGSQDLERVLSQYSGKACNMVSSRPSAGC